MVLALALIREVDEVFAQRDPALVEWPHPWPGRSPDDDAYSVCTDPLKYRLLGARTDAWAQALMEREVMRLEPDSSTAWSTDAAPRPLIERTDRWIPAADRAIPFAVGRLTVDGNEDVGVALGAGEPAVMIQSIPDCGCDACDSGSTNDIEWIDSIVMSAITGVLRYSQAEHHTETVLIDSRSSTSGRKRFRGWRTIIEGAPWLDVTEVNEWLESRP